MGWFSSDEIVQIVDTSAHDTLQTVALAELSFVVLAYGMIKLFNHLNGFKPNA